MSMVSAPPRTPVYMWWGSYGQLGGARPQAQTRMWLLADDLQPGSPVRCRIAWNHPATGRVEWEDMGEIVNARIRVGSQGPTSAEVHLIDGRTVTLSVAPCVCGAGAVANAAPVEGRISLHTLNPYTCPRIQIG